MVYLPQDEEEQKKNAQTPLQTVGSPGLFSPAGVPSAGSSAAPTSTKAGNFTGITKYLEKNQLGAAGLGQQVAQDISRKGEAARTAIGEAQQKFGGYLESQNVGKTPNILQQVQETPEALAADPTKVAEFKQLQSGAYQGPNTLEESQFYAPAQAALQPAQQAGELSQNEAGRQQLLSRTGKRSRGALALDTALLEGSTEARSAIEAAQKGLGDIQGRFSTASEAGKTGASATRKSNQSVIDALKQSQGTFKSSIAQKIDAARAGAGVRDKELREALGALEWKPVKLSGGRGRKVYAGDVGGIQGNLSPEILADLGITQADWDKIVKNSRALNTSGLAKTKAQILAEQEGRELLPTDLAYRRPEGYEMAAPPTDPFELFLKAAIPEEAITAGNVSSPEDYARLKALQTLSGNLEDYGLSTPEQAGKAPAEITNLDNAAILAELERQRVLHQSGRSKQQEDRLKKKEENRKRKEESREKKEAEKAAEEALKKKEAEEAARAALERMKGALI